MRDTEVEQLDRSVGAAKDVPGFDVAMNDTERVSGFERGARLNSEIDHLMRRQRSALEHAIEARPFEELERDVWRSVGDIGGEDADNVRMLDPKLGFALEPSDQLRVASRRQNLDRNRCSVRIGPPIHEPHAARSEQWAERERTQPLLARRGELAVVFRAEISTTKECKGGETREDRPTHDRAWSTARARASRKSHGPVERADTRT
jgi:hypothetical protein